MSENKNINQEIIEEEYMLGKEYYSKILELAKKKKQSNNFIFDISDSEITIESVSKQIERIYKNKERRWVDKIMVKQNKDVIVINKRK